MEKITDRWPCGLWGLIIMYIACGIFTYCIYDGKEEDGSNSTPFFLRLFLSIIWPLPILVWVFAVATMNIIAGTTAIILFWRDEKGDREKAEKIADRLD